MSTRSAVSRDNGGQFKGRYIHWDGYPTGVGIQLCNIIRAFGAEEAAKIIVDDNYGWSHLDSTTPQALTGNDAQYYDEPRFKTVAGFGVAYTDTKGTDGYQQATSEDWITETDSWWTEWQYAIAPNGDVTVYDHFEEIGKVNAFDDDYQQKLKAIEESE